MASAGKVLRPASRLASLPWHVCNRARLKRDKQFDGVFFVAVSTTGIFCRPVCPSKHSRDEHVTFYFEREMAFRDGFRACKRCRPETQPGSPAWIGTLATVRRGKRFIESGFLDHSTVGELAAKLGLGSRHLTRLFVQHAGHPPVVFAQQRRVRIAERLLKVTSLSVSQVAFAAGFHSLRRFNSAFKEMTGYAPSEFRQLGAAASPGP
jgi:AraC family transcriptional regulator, regulatory protein of adaptative response / methylated-DNA-[protein]-cysteine methyltransferase